jgi:hypothetical protein
MHKAIRLKVKLTLWIEGEAEPAEDFAALTTEAVHRLIALGSAQLPGLMVKVEKIEEDRSDEEDEDASG